MVADRNGKMHLYIHLLLATSHAVGGAGRGSCRTKGGRNTCDPDLGPQFHHLLPLLRDPRPSVAELCCAPLLGFFVSLIKGFRNGLRRGLRTMSLALKGKHQGRQAVDFGSHQEEQGGEEESGRRHRAACSQWWSVWRVMAAGSYMVKAMPR